MLLFYSNQKIGDCTFSVESDGAYVTYTPTGGADPVTKKLGEPDVSGYLIGTYSGTGSKTYNLPEAIYSRSDFDSLKIKAYGGADLYKDASNACYITLSTSYNSSTHVVTVKYNLNNGGEPTSYSKSCRGIVYYEL